MKDFTLRSGITIPVIGFGPGIMGYSANIRQKRSLIARGIWRIYNRVYKGRCIESSYIDSVANAIKLGYRLIDYSMAYRNLALIHKAILKSNVNRNELFLTTRISNNDQFCGTVREKFLQNLKAWNTDYIDLLQFHWPVTGKYIGTWQEMIRLKEDGYVRVLGTANCHSHHLEKLYSATGILPEVNQIEVHPLFTQKTLIEYCKKKDIRVEAYTPVARYDDRLIRLPVMKELEQKYEKDLIQIILRWHIQNGVIPVIRSLNPKHQASNINIFDFELSEEDMLRIDRININSRLRYDPDNCDFTIL